MRFGYKPSRFCEGEVFARIGQGEGIMTKNFCAATIASAILGALPAHAAVNDDIHECKFVHSQQGIDACTRLLTEVVWTEAHQPAWVYFGRGTDYSELGQDKLALSDLNEAIKEAPAFSDAFINRAALYMRAGQLQLAKADFDTVIALNPDYLQTTGSNPYAKKYFATPTDIARMDRARLEVLLGDLPAAIADADTAKKRNPIDPAALAADCWVHGVKGDQLDTALADCNAAIDSAPDNATYLFNRGFVRYRMNDLPGALKDLDRATAINTTFESALYVRGLVKAKAGDAAGSKADIDAAIAIYPKIAARVALYGITP